MLNVERDINKAKSGGADDLIYRTITGLNVGIAGSSVDSGKGDAIDDDDDVDSGDSDDDDEGTLLGRRYKGDIFGPCIYMQFYILKFLAHK